MSTATKIITVSAFIPRDALNKTMQDDIEAKCNFPLGTAGVGTLLKYILVCLGAGKQLLSSDAKEFCEEGVKSIVKMLRDAETIWQKNSKDLKEFKKKFKWNNVMRAKGEFQPNNGPIGEQTFSELLYAFYKLCNLT